jgi:hypothetical protein
MVFPSVTLFVVIADPSFWMLALYLVAWAVSCHVAEYGGLTGGGVDVSKYIFVAIARFPTKSSCYLLIYSI